MKAISMFCTVIFCLTITKANPNSAKKGVTTLNPKDPSIKLSNPGIKVDLKGTPMGDAVKAIGGDADSIDVSNYKTNEVVPKGKSTRVRFNLPKDEKKWTYNEMMGVGTFHIMMPNKKLNPGDTYCMVTVSNVKAGDLAAALPNGFKPVRTIHFSSAVVDRKEGKKKTVHRSNGYSMYLRSPIQSRNALNEDMMGMTHDSSVSKDISLNCNRTGANVSLAHQPFEFESLLRATGMDQYVKLELNKLPNYKVPEAPKPSPGSAPLDGGDQPAAEETRS